ncbi:MAG: hypothetical protein GY708_26370, partial [Actinomycetia bacterium]|nr:hypothetical protein [Actinomycetes bacterium]
PERPEVLWEDLAPTERSYAGAPEEVLARLQHVPVVVVLPESWHGSQSDGGICSRTPEALHECYGFTSLELMTDGRVGFSIRGVMVPGEPVTLVLFDEQFRLRDIVEIPAAELQRALDDESLAVIVDLRGLYGSLDLPPSTLEQFPEAVEPIDIRVEEPPTRVTTPVGGEGD